MSADVLSRAFDMADACLASVSTPEQAGMILLLAPWLALKVGLLSEDVAFAMWAKWRAEHP